MHAKADFLFFCLICGLLDAPLFAAAGRGVNESELCRKLEACYKNVVATEVERGKVFDLHLERLCYLVLTVGEHSKGSRRLDEILTKIQKGSPTLVVPRYVMFPSELENLLAKISSDDENDLAYSAYRRRARTLSEFIDKAKEFITQRDGFKFDPSVPVIRSQ